MVWSEERLPGTKNNPGQLEYLPVNYLELIHVVATLLYQQIQLGIMSWFGFLPEADDEIKIQVKVYLEK